VINKINISEEDIFNYVFLPESLDDEKRNYLDANREKFTEQINFCRAMNNKLSEEEEISLSERVKKKFPLRSAVVYELYPSRVTITDEQGCTKMAAASGKPDKEIEVESFTNDNSNYLVRLLRKGRNYKMNLFVKGNKSISKVKIEILPSGQILHSNDIKIPIEFESDKEIEKIRIEEIEG